MTTYNVSFVSSYCVVSTTITTDDISEVVGLAEDTIKDDLGFAMPDNCSVEIEEIN
jgi:hypothetical protein